MSPKKKSLTEPFKINSFKNGCVVICRYCYYECLDVEPELALSTQYAAKKYMLPLLEVACRKTQIKALRPENIWTAYTCSMEWGDEELHKGCQEYFKKNTIDIISALKSPAFLTLSHGVLLDMLRLNDVERNEYSQFPELGPHGILVPEIELFKACDAWAEAECKRQELEVSGANKRVVLGDCLPLIRFPAINGYDLVKTVFPTTILTHDEKFRLLGFTQPNPSDEWENNTGFLATNSDFLIKLKPRLGAMKKNGTCSSEVYLEPKFNMHLAKMWILGDACHCKGPEFHFAEGNRLMFEEKLDFCTQNEMTEDGRLPLLHLPIDAFLEAGNKYMLQVDHKVKDGRHLHEHTANGPLNESTVTIDKKGKLPEMLNLTIREKGKNNCIVGLTARLL